MPGVDQQRSFRPREFDSPGIHVDAQKPDLVYMVALANDASVHLDRHAVLELMTFLWFWLRGFNSAHHAAELAKIRFALNAPTLIEAGRRLSTNSSSIDVVRDELRRAHAQLLDIDVSTLTTESARDGCAAVLGEAEDRIEKVLKLLAAQPSPNEDAGMTWWNGLTDWDRSWWLARPGVDTAADAWALFQSRQQ